jgi:hypothetical protein
MAKHGCNTTKHDIAGKTTLQGLGIIMDSNAPSVRPEILCLNRLAALDVLAATIYNG